MTDADSTLVERARRGDSAAFGALVRRYMQPAYAVALARLREPADAEDVCQEAFVTALKRIEECRDPDRFGAWLLAIVRNRAHDYGRKLAVRASLPLGPETAAHARDDPQADLERSERRGDLLRAIGVLTELQREVLLLRDFEGWSHREIARQLEISEGSARVHLHNGRKALRAELAALRKEDG
jgi:RNA polymerase sigma-70 factor (ECF subfamily)